MAPPTSTPEERAAKRDQDRAALRALMRVRRKDVQVEELRVENGGDDLPAGIPTLDRRRVRQREEEEPLLSLEEFVGLGILPQVNVPPWSAEGQLSEASSPLSPTFSVASTALSTLDDFPSPPSTLPTPNHSRPLPPLPSSTSSTRSPTIPTRSLPPLPSIGLLPSPVPNSGAFSPSRPPAAPLPPLPSTLPSASPAFSLPPTFDPHIPPRVPLPPLPPSASSTSLPIRTSPNPSLLARPLSFSTPPTSPAPSQLSARSAVPSPILTARRRSSTYVELEDIESEGSPVEFESLLATPLPKRRLSRRRESPKRSRDRSLSSEKGGAVLGESEDETSQDSEIDVEASLETLAWRAGIMKRDLIGGESASDAEEVEERRTTIIEASVRPLAREGDVTRNERRQSAKNYRKSYKLLRKPSQEDDDLDAALSSEEEESFDLSFDSHSNASGSTPSLSPFSHSRRSTASSYGFPSASSNTTPKASPRRSQDSGSLLSPPLKLGEGGKNPERRSWNGTGKSSRVSRTDWRASSLSAPDESLARADDSPPLPSSSRLPSLGSSPSPTTPRRIPTSPGTLRHRTSIVRPSTSRPLSGTSDASSTSEAGWKSSSSLPSRRKSSISTLSTPNRSSILPPTPKKSSIPSSRRSSIASSTSSTRSSTRRSSVVSPPPLPDPSLLPLELARALSPSLRKPYVRSPTSSSPSALPRPGGIRIGAPPGAGSRLSVQGSKAGEQSRVSTPPYLGRKASRTFLRTPTKASSKAEGVDEFGRVEGAGRARTLPVLNAARR